MLLSTILRLRLLHLCGAAVIIYVLLSTIITSSVVVFVFGYDRTPCRRIDRPQFQFPDCYIPPLNRNLLLSDASFVMSHDAATGYITKTSLVDSGAIIASYGKNQVGTAYDQLNDGARALDLRPKYLTNGTVIFHHGIVNIPITLQHLVSDVIRWCNENNDELVLLLSSELTYESYDDEYNDDSFVAIEAMAAIYQKLGVTYVKCSDVYGLTIQETMELATLPSSSSSSSSDGGDGGGGGGGYLLALDGQDRYASFCGKSNWISNRLVTCYPPGGTEACTRKPNSQPMAALRRYVLASANNVATDDRGTLGPPANLYYHPFNEIQALWQVTVESAVAGLAHFSTIINDNTVSKVNAAMVDIIYNQDFAAVSLFAIDNVALNGNAILSVLRNTCGQQQQQEQNDDNSEVQCGRNLPPPKLTYFHMSSWIGWTMVYVTIASLAFLVVCRKEDKRVMYTFCERLKCTMTTMRRDDKHDDNDGSYSRREELLAYGSDGKTLATATTTPNPTPTTHAHTSWTRNGPSPMIQ